MKLSSADIIRKIQPLTVRIDSADINPVDLYYHFSRCSERKAIFLALKAFGQFIIRFDKCRAVGSKIHISLFQLSRLIIIEFKIHFGNLTGFSDSEIGYLVFFAVNMPFEPAEAQIYPLLGSHASSFNLNMCHNSTSYILKIGLFSDSDNLDALTEIFFYPMFNPGKTAVKNQAF